MVKDTCAEFGVKYNQAKSFREAVGLHFDHLKFMGNRDDIKSNTNRF